MDYFFMQLLNGLSLGCIYALLALGFSIVYGVLKLLNFAHSEIFTTGAFAALFCEQWLLSIMPGQPLLIFIISLFVASLASGLMAVLIELIGYRPLRHASKASVLLTAIGMSILLQNVGILVFSAGKRGFPTLELPWNPIEVTLSLLVLSYIVLMLLIYRTSIGLRIRAVAEDPERAELMGIHINRTIALTFFIGGAFAGVAAMVWGHVYGQVHPQMGFNPALKAFIIAVIGTIGYLNGSFLMGVLLGIFETMIAAYLPSDYSAFRDVVVFSLLLAILAWKPAGLFGKTQVEKV